MAKNIYVGNLAWDATADDLLALFQEHGQVARAQVITDRETGRSRGFGFVEMDNDAEAQKAIDALNGFMLPGPAPDGQRGPAARGRRRRWRRRPERLRRRPAAAEAATAAAVAAAAVTAAVAEVVVAAAVTAVAAAITSRRPVSTSNRRRARPRSGLSTS